MNDKELSRCEKKAREYRRSRNYFIVLCIVLAALCGYAITQWQREKVARVEFEKLYGISEQIKSHYQQQWVDALFKCNKYQQLYEDCQNQDENRWE